MTAFACRLFFAVMMLGLATQTFFTQGALAQGFPSRTVTMIIPFPPGGGNDIVGRYLADELGKMWGKTVVVENRGGAGGAIGAAAVARSAPDGHTILFNSASYTTNAVSTSHLNFDPINDLSLVVTTGVIDMIVTVGNHVPVNSVRELVDLSKQRKLIASMIGPFPTLLVIDATGLEATRVPYKGAGDIHPNILGGRIDVYVATASAATALLQEKQIKPLATMGRERTRNLPDTPTMTELGYTGADMELWWGVFVPSKTPDDIKQQIHRDVTEIMNRPQSVEFLAKVDARPHRIRLDEGHEFVKSEIAKWKKLGEKYGMSGAN